MRAAHKAGVYLIKSRCLILRSLFVKGDGCFTSLRARALPTLSHSTPCRVRYQHESSKTRLMLIAKFSQVWDTTNLLVNSHLICRSIPPTGICIPPTADGQTIETKNRSVIQAIESKPTGRQYRSQLNRTYGPREMVFPRLLAQLAGAGM